MNAVMLSIRPKWCVKIANGEKTIEVRKTRPKIEPPFKCYIYCTKGGEDIWTKNYERDGYLNGKVIGEFVCDRIYQYTTTSVKDGTDISDADMERMSRLDRAALMKYETSAQTRDYCLTRYGLFGWHIFDLVIYDTPKELREFWRLCPEYDELGPNCWDCENRCGDDEVDCNVDGRLYLTRPPQSWMYVEEI